MAKLNHLNTPALEVLVDIARTIGERRYVSGGDSRDDWRDMCEWADEFQARFESNPDAGETYMVDVEQFAVEKAVNAGWSVCEAINSDHAIQIILSADGIANDAFDVRVNELPRLQQQAGAAYTLYLTASKAIQDASGDANAVNWDQVHQDVFAKAVGQDKQPAAAVLEAIKLHSPGAVTPEQIAAVDALEESMKVIQPIKIPVVLGKNRTRGNSVGAMIDDMYGEHTELCSLLAKEARGQGVDPSADWVTNAVGSLLRLYEKAHDAWLSSKGDTIGHVYEAELPSGTKLLMGSRQILGQIDEVTNLSQHGHGRDAGADPSH